MTHKCKATDSRPWLSKINNVDEGEITVGTEDADGGFRGRHKGLNKDTAGLCFKAGGGQPDKILFVVPANNPEYLYIGAIDGSGESLAGQRLSFTAFFETKADTKAALLGDDWTAEKPPTLTGEEDDSRTERT